MTNVLPKVAGLQINGVFYRYTTTKNTEDDMLVHVQNKNLSGDGYIFRSTDDWSKLPGNTIQRTVPVPNIFGNLFGDGSIEIEGKGSVSDAFVVYTYQYDPCFDPQSDPVCPGYKIPVDFDVEVVEVSDPLNDDLIRREFERRASVDDEDEREKARARAAANAAAERRQNRLEAALSAVNTALMTAEAAVAANDFFAVAAIPDNYQIQIPGGEYRETVRLLDARLPDNPRGIRNTWAQQLLHEQMVDLQYENSNQNEE